jgi:hypothetical protein
MPVSDPIRDAASRVIATVKVWDGRCAGQQGDHKAPRARTDDRGGHGGKGVT